MSLGWIIRYLFDFFRALPEQCEFHHIAEDSSSEEKLGEAKKRKIEQDQAQEERSNKKRRSCEMRAIREVSKQKVALNLFPPPKANTYCVSFL